MGSLQSGGFGKMGKEAIVMFPNTVTRNGSCNIKKFFIFPLQLINIPRIFSEQTALFYWFCREVVVHLLSGKK
jgi:hypothetical protein